MLKPEIEKSPSFTSGTKWPHSLWTISVHEKYTSDIGLHQLHQQCILMVIIYKTIQEGRMTETNASLQNFGQEAGCLEA